jgi:hypothetical protein
MNRKSLFILSLCYLTLPSIHPRVISPIDDRDVIGRSFFHPRSQGSNNALESVALPRHFIQDYNCATNTILIASPGYSSSFDRDAIGRYLFFNGTATMTTGTADGVGVDIFGENFLLNDNFGSAITAKPQAKNGFVDFALWATLDRYVCGLYLFAHAPLVHTDWKVDLIETVSSTGTVIGANNLGNPADAAAPENSMTCAWNGQSTFFDVSKPMRYARIDGAKKETKIADVELAIGYAFINKETSYLSFNLRTIIPTGNRPDGVYAFEPIVGNGKHWELGAGVLGNLELWNNGCDQSLSAFINANVYTMFKTNQYRTFDLKKNGVGSRYLLLKRFNPDHTYAGEIVRGPNVLTLPVKAYNTVHGDAAFMLDYIFGSWTLDLGYNIWGRSNDKLSLQKCIPELTYGVAGLSGTGANANTTASCTLISGENATVIDPNPVYISNCDLDIKSAEHPGTFTNSVFAYLGHTWGCRMEPFVGIGTQLEFAGISNTAFRMWYVYGRFGLSFF